MSTIANLSSSPSALPAINIHPHGHKRGSHVGSTDDSGGGTTAQAPAGAVQKLFGRLIQSLEQVIGVQLSAATPAVTATNAAIAGGAATDSPTPKVAGSNVNIHA